MYFKTWWFPDVQEVHEQHPALLHWRRCKRPRLHIAQVTFGGGGDDDGGGDGGDDDGGDGGDDDDDDDDDGDDDGVVKSLQGK